MELHKYTSIDHALDSLKHGIYAGQIKDFNDPYEAEGIVFPEDYRVCCTSSSNKQMFMWAYYGHHRGCCIQFHVPDDLENVKKVEYKREYICHREMDSDEIYKSLYQKSLEWKHENEIRIVYSKNNADKSLWNCIGENVYFIAKPKSIMLGLLVDFDDIIVQKLLRDIKTLNDNSEEKIQVKKCMLSSSKYQLITDKQFDYERHIV